MMFFFEQSMKVEKIYYQFKTEDRHIVSNFSKCKLHTSALVLENSDSLIYLIEHCEKIERKYIYLAIKHPYNPRYYFKTNNELLFSIEKITIKKYLITILDVNNKVYLSEISNAKDVIMLENIINKL